MGGGAETFLNVVIWVGKEENIYRQKICQKMDSSFIKLGGESKYDLYSYFQFRTVILQRLV